MTALLQQAFDALDSMGATDFYPELMNDLEEAIEKLSQQERKSAWNDAPTVPGLWIKQGKDTYQTLLIILPPWESGWEAAGDRWYGPIPEDKP